MIGARAAIACDFAQAAEGQVIAESGNIRSCQGYGDSQHRIVDRDLHEHPQQYILLVGDQLGDLRIMIHLGSREGVCEKLRE